MSTLLDLSNTRDQLNLTLDDYKQATIDFLQGTIDSTEFASWLALAQEDGYDLSVVIREVRASNPELPLADLFSSPTLIANNRYEDVAQIMMTGALNIRTLVNILGDTPGAIYDPLYLETMFQDSGKLVPTTGTNQLVHVMESTGAAVKDAYQYGTNRQPILKVENDVHYLKTDGIDDFMSSPNLLASDELTLVYAVRRDAGDKYGRIFDSRGNGGLADQSFPGIKGVMIKCDNTPPYASIIVEDGNYKAWNWTDNVPADQDFVMTFRWSADPTKRMYRVNGVEIAPSRSDANMGSVAVTGNGAHRLFGSMGDNQFFPGRFYGSLVAHRAITDEEVVRAENVFAKRLGLSINA